MLGQSGYTASREDALLDAIARRYDITNGEARWLIDDASRNIEDVAFHTRIPAARVREAACSGGRVKVPAAGSTVTTPPVTMAPSHSRT